MICLLFFFVFFLCFAITLFVNLFSLVLNNSLDLDEMISLERHPLSGIGAIEPVVTSILKQRYSKFKTIIAYMYIVCYQVSVLPLQGVFLACNDFYMVHHVNISISNSIAKFKCIIREHVRKYTTCVL